MSLLYDRVTRYIAIFADADFRADCKDGNLEPLDILDDECSDVGVAFKTLEEVLHHFPGREQWQKDNIRRMVAEVFEQQNRDRRAQKGEAPAAVEPSKHVLRQRVDKLAQQIKHVSDERDEAVTAKDQLSIRVEHAEKRVAALEAENRELRDTVTKQQGQIEELERILGGQLAGAQVQ